MRLYFLRHAIAEEATPKTADFDRRLTDDGIKKFKKAARQYPAWDIEPSVIYSSPLVRAHQTTQLVANYLDAEVKESELLAPGFNMDALRQLVLQHPPSDDLMFVGHEPDFSDVISAVIGGGQVTMKKGGLARVDVLNRSPLTGALVWLVPTRVLR